MITVALTAYLESDAGISALVGDRCYRVIMPQGATVPAITYHNIATTPMYDKLGPAGHVRTRIQFDCWAKTIAGAIEVARALRLALDGYHGPMGGLDIHAVCDNEHDDYDPETGLYRVVCDYLIWYNEEV